MADNVRQMQGFASLAVSLNRGKYGPLDVSTVFYSQAEFDWYLSFSAGHPEGTGKTRPTTIPDDFVARPYEAQIVALCIGDDEAKTSEITLYVLSRELESPTTEGLYFNYTEVGAKTLGDGNSIVLEDGILSIVGFGNASANQVPYKDTTTGKIGWKAIGELIDATAVTNGSDKAINVTFDNNHTYTVQLAGNSSAAATNAVLRKQSDGTFAWEVIYNKTEVDGIVSNINTNVSNVASDLANEAARAKAAELELGNRATVLEGNVSTINTEIVNINTNVSTLRTDLTTETNRATTKEGVIDSNVSALEVRVENLEARGRFLSTWNAGTGLPGDYPSVPSGAEYPYTYAFKAGDYYIVNAIPESGTVYMPDGTGITKPDASTAWTVGKKATTNEIGVGDEFLYTTTGWVWVQSTTKTIGFSQITGNVSDNTKLVTEFGTKVDKTQTIAGIDLQDNITAEELRTGLNVANGAQVNVIEKVRVNGADLTVDAEKRVDIGNIATQAAFDALVTRVNTAESDIDALEGRATALEGNVTTLQGNVAKLTTDIANETTRAEAAELTLSNRAEEISLVANAANASANALIDGTKKAKYAETADTANNALKLENHSADYFAVKTTVDTEFGKVVYKANLATNINELNDGSIIAAKVASNTEGTNLSAKLDSIDASLANAATSEALTAEVNRATAAEANLSTAVNTATTIATTANTSANDALANIAAILGGTKTVPLANNATYLNGKAASVYENKIEEIQVNNSALTITNKAVNIETITAGNLATLNVVDEDHLDSNLATKINNKVDKVDGKSLVLDTEIAKLANVSEGANKVEASTQNGYIKIDGTETKVFNESSIIANIATKVDKTQTIAGIDLQDNISADSLRTALNVTNGATKVEASTTNGNIKINGTETIVYNDSAVVANVAQLQTNVSTIEANMVNKSDILILNCGNAAGV